MKLTWEGDSVISVCFDGAVTLQTSADYELRVETNAAIEIPGEAALAFDPERPGTVAARLVNLIGKRVSRAEATNTGVLDIHFDDRVQLVVPPNDNYEAWSISGPRQERIVCMPGGELAIWSKADN